MRQFFSIIANTKVGYAILYVLIVIFITPFIYLGRFLYYLTKLLRIISYFLMGFYGSAKKELKDWSIYATDIKDVL